MPFRAQNQSGSRAGTAVPERQPSLPYWEREWAEAQAAERVERLRIAGRARSRLVLVGLVALVAAAAAALFPLTPGFSAEDALAAVIAAAVASLLAVSVVYLSDRSARSLPESGAGEQLVFTAALASAAAAAVHFSVIKMHFAEFALYGVFFVLSGIAQLVWPVWLLFRRWPPLLALGAIGNGLIVVLWAVDRLGWVPIGPDARKPPPFGFGDTVTSGLELALVACCIVLLVRGRGRALRRTPALSLSLLVGALTTLALLSVLGVAASVLTPSM